MTEFAVSPALKAAITAVRQASRVCQSVQHRLVAGQTLEKGDKSPVTVADFASQAVVCAALAEHLPDDKIVGEEDAADLRTDEQSALRNSVVEHARTVHPGATEQQVLDWIDRGNDAGRGDRHWTLDPIDGTKGFLRGEQYAVALALIEKGQVTVGVLGCPNLPAPDSDETGFLLVAQRGHGCQLLPLEGDAFEGKHVQASDVQRPEDARFCESVESAHSDQSQSAQIAKHLGITAEPVRMDSQCKYATVAQGLASIYLRLPVKPGYVEKIWDHAAGMICVEEAGGRVTDIDGKPLDFTHGGKLEANRGIIATNGPIHDAVLDAVKATS